MAIEKLRFPYETDSRSEFMAKGQFEFKRVNSLNEIDPSVIVLRLAGFSSRFLHESQPVGLGIEPIGARQHNIICKNQLLSSHRALEGSLDRGHVARSRGVA